MQVTTDLTTEVTKAYKEMTREFEGTTWKGTMYNEVCTLPQLRSSQFPQKSGVYGEESAYGLNKGILFRAEVLIDPHRPELFLGGMFEAKSDGNFTVHLKTNDPDYVESHRNIVWRRT